MNYITSCPKCDTQFVINDELIKSYRGKVQCGSCALVFNAKTRLTEIADDITSAEEYQASLENEAASTAEENNTVEEIIIAPPADSSDEADNAAIDQYISGASNTVDDFSAHVTSVKKEKTKVKHPVLVSLFALLLILGAALQTIYHMRVRIAAEYPQFKPLLVKACEPLKCTIGLPKTLEAITIGDSDMQENDSYQSVINFTSSLTNTNTYPVAYPNIILTLTDADDRVVIQKRVQPQNYLLPNTDIEAGIPGRGVSKIKLPLFVDDAVVAGYRILLTYP